jgi:predicted lysophospholipase L1 biosynthesis ABC-type transport system permease subunit
MRDWGAPYEARVVGVVRNVRQNGLEAAPSATVYFPFAQFPEGTISHSIVVRHTGNVDGAATAIRRALAAADPDQPITSLISFEGILARSLAERRFNTLLVATFGALALLLATVGLYGLIAYALASRRRELAIRVSLGATPSQIVSVGVAMAGTPIAWGIVTGVGAAIGAARVARSALFGVTPTDPLALAGAVGAILTAALIACAGPIWGALRADPLPALKGE